MAQQQQQKDGPRLGPTRTPLHKLTLGILETYRHINEVYIADREARAAAAAASQDSASEAADAQPVASCDDKNADYIVRVGEVYGARYEARALLGKGSFGQVVRAWDRVDHEEVAIKIIKNKLPFYKQACIEVQLLRHLNSNDAADQCKIVRMKEFFKHMNHLCIVFEMMSYNLYELLNITQFSGISLPLVRKFAQQILTSLAFLSSDRVRVIHCDLKPENILLKNPKRSAIKLIDFGSSCLSDKAPYKYIQSRYYRSPEVIMGLPYSYPIDMWSLGCILVELHTGDPLFNGRNEVDQIMKIAGVLGLPPKHMIEPSAKVKRLFQRGVDGGFVFVPSLQEKMVYRALSDIVGVEAGGPKGRRKGESGHSASEYRKFVDLVEHMLAYDPAKRITPSVALAHPFIRGDEPHVPPMSLLPSAPSMVSVVEPERKDKAPLIAVPPPVVLPAPVPAQTHALLSQPQQQQPKQQQQQQSQQRHQPRSSHSHHGRSRAAAATAATAAAPAGHQPTKAPSNAIGADVSDERRLSF